MKGVDEDGQKRIFSESRCLVRIDKIVFKDLSLPSWSPKDIE